MEKIIIVNHKMNLTLDEVKNYIKILKPYKEDFIIFPSTIYIPYFTENGFHVGVQNIHHKNSGPYTGEISARQAKSAKVEYVMIGHFERRYLNEKIEEKLNIALENGLKVVYCIGESNEEDYKESLQKQLKLIKYSNNIIICYEPEISIGTNRLLDNLQLIERIDYIKKMIPNIKVIYGGSVNAQTVIRLKQIDLLSGFAVGSAGLDPNELLKIKEVC